MPDAALPEALEAGSLQKVSTSNISTPSKKKKERKKNTLAQH